MPKPVKSPLGKSQSTPNLKTLGSTGGGVGKSNLLDRRSQSLPNLSLSGGSSLSRQKLSNSGGNPEGKVRWTIGDPTLLEGVGPDTWVIKYSDGGNEKILTSSREPKFWGLNWTDFIYEVTKGGKTKLAGVPRNGNSGWQKNSDIIWITNNQ